MVNTLEFGCGIVFQYDKMFICFSILFRSSIKNGKCIFKVGCASVLAL